MKPKIDAVAARMLPAGPRKTRMRGDWLVNAEAKEGTDYQLDKLLPFWQLSPSRGRLWRTGEAGPAAAA